MATLELMYFKVRHLNPCLSCHWPLFLAEFFPTEAGQHVELGLILPRVPYTVSLKTYIGLKDPHSMDFLDT